MHSSFEEVGESLEPKVHSESRRTLGSYNKIHKGARPKINWVASSRVGRNPESVQGYLHEMLVPARDVSTCTSMHINVIISKLP